ncbi:MAG: adenosylmethionine decarboxylase [Kiloniellales bacterium]|nr:adenosylmethionine decarboxylase [Kiloniellales bacterium]
MSNVHALFQSGIDLEFLPSAPEREDRKLLTGGEPAHRAVMGGDERKDFFVEKNGERFAGTHLIIDLWDCQGIDDLELVDRTLRECVDAAGATLLHIHLHHFTPNNGVSGVAVLAESHISIHSWPEIGYAALDVFMCGEANPHAAVEVLEKNFRPSHVEVGEHLRGRGL